MEAPPTIVWLTGVFQHRLHWCLTSDPSWVSCHQSFHRRSRCRQVIMNIAVVIYSVIWAAEEDYIWFWRESALDLPKCIYVCTNHSWSSFIYRRSEYNVFKKNLCKPPFLIMCQWASFMMNAALCKQSLRKRLGREGRSQQSSLTFKGEWHNMACSEKSCFWQAKKDVFYTSN